MMSHLFRTNRTAGVLMLTLSALGWGGLALVLAGFWSPVPTNSIGFWSKVLAGLSGTLWWLSAAYPLLSDKDDQVQAWCNAGAALAAFGAGSVFVVGS